MEIRLLNNDDFLDLLRLYVAMGKSIDVTLTEFDIANTLLKCVTESNTFFAVGLYEDNEAIGFTCGWGLDPHMFYFSGIFMKNKLHKKLKDLIDYSFAEAKRRGYKRCTFEVHGNNMASILEKYNATITSVKYVKEL